MRDFSRWYEETYPELSHSGLWLRGGEINTLPRAEWEKRDFRTLWVRLSTYFDTGYSFTHQLLYQLGAETEGVYPDLAYLPPRGDIAVMERDQVPWLLGTQSKRSAESFDLIAFSNSIVQEILNLPAFLRTSGIPLEKSKRIERADLPLVILGGANALYTSALWGEEPWVDAVFVGESDAAIVRVLEICRDGKRVGLSKREILKKLEEVPGFFEPEAPRATKKAFIPNLNQARALENGPVYYLDDQLGSSHLQISEGCPCFCSFCAESWDRKPYRERASKKLLEVALKMKANMGLDHIDIYSFNFNMHSGIYQILWDLVPHFRGIGLKSQRFDILAHDPQMMEFQHAIEKASITCGLEGISPRLRKYLHKNLEDPELHRSIEAIFKSKAREMKVFLIATGLEEEQDFEALEDLLEHLEEIRARIHSGTRIILSMTPLVRFPWTPLEFEQAPTMAHYERIISRTAKRVRAKGFEFRESADLPEYWTSQVLVRADDVRVRRALLAALEKTRFTYHREVSAEFQRVFLAELVAQGLSEAELLAGFDLEASRSKPWARIDTSVKREFLWEEVLRARSYVEIDYCLGRSWAKAKCFHCGGCPTRFHVRDIVLSKQTRDYTLEQFKSRIRAARESQVALDLEVEAGESARGVPRRMLGVAVARALMLTVPQLRLHYRGYQGSRWDEGARPTWVLGRDVLRSFWNAQALPVVRQTLESADVLARVNAELGSWGRIAGIATQKWEEYTPSEMRVDAPYGVKAEG